MVHPCFEHSYHERYKQNDPYEADRHRYNIPVKGSQNPSESWSLFNQVRNEGSRRKEEVPKFYWKTQANSEGCLFYYFQRSQAMRLLWKRPSISSYCRKVKHYLKLQESYRKKRETLGKDIKEAPHNKCYAR